MVKQEPLTQIGADTPLRLAVAAKIAFPDGSITAAGLRRESSRGRLEIERIAGKDYTTLANIERMRHLCRVERKASDSGFGPNEAMGTVTSVEQAGSSSMGANISPQAALRAKLKQQKTSSLTMWPQKTGRPEKLAT